MNDDSERFNKIVMISETYSVCVTVYEMCVCILKL